MDQFELFVRSRFVKCHSSPIFILGNQKSGTSAIAALLGELTGLPTTIDLTMEYLSKKPSYIKVKNKEMSFEKFVNRNKFDFSKKIIKEPNLTLFYKELSSFFPESRFVFIVRDPRDNIRSILNRLQLPGHLFSLNSNQTKTLPKGWETVIDGRWLKLTGENYIEMLAFRWNLMAETYIRNQEHMILIRYEDFIKDKARHISTLAKLLGLPNRYDITDKVDIQYQPKGKGNHDWHSFFGPQNLQRINSICAPNMIFFNYLN